MGRNVRFSFFCTRPGFASYGELVELRLVAVVPTGKRGAAGFCHFLHAARLEERA
jgi:hypothetical protein